jgi:hypothetical protein
MRGQFVSKFKTRTNFHFSAGLLPRQLPSEIRTTKR